MRNPPPGHIHNTLCPHWEQGDTEAPRPECNKNRTFTLFDINPFTKSGMAHHELLEERDRKARERKYGSDE